MVKSRLRLFVTVLVTTVLLMTGMAAPAQASSSSGVVTISEKKHANQAYDQGSAITVDRKGRVIVVAQLGYSRIAIYRFKQNGRLDKTFSKDGKAYIKTRYEAHQVTTDSKNRVIIAATVDSGSLSSKSRIYRFTNKGNLDKSFGKKGVYSRSNAGVSGVTVDSKDRVMVGGQIRKSKGHNTGYVSRLTAKGKLDKSYGNKGQRLLSIYGSQETGWLGTAFGAGGFDAQGRFLVAVSVYKGMFQAQEYGVARLTPNGSFDTSYGQWESGYNVKAYKNGSDDIFGVAARGFALHSDGRVSMGGGASVGDFVNLVFDPQGYTSGPDIFSFAKTTLGSDAVVAAPGGKTIASGVTGVYNKERIGLTRILANGKLDSGFGSKGKVNVRVPGTKNLTFGDMAIDAKGRPLVLVTSENKKSSRVSVIRLTTSGKNDSSWRTR